MLKKSFEITFRKINFRISDAKIGNYYKCTDTAIDGGYVMFHMERDKHTKKEVIEEAKGALLRHYFNKDDFEY